MKKLYITYIHKICKDCKLNLYCETNICKKYKEYFIYFHYYVDLLKINNKNYNHIPNIYNYKNL